MTCLLVQVAYGHHRTNEVGLFFVAREVGTGMRMGTVRLPEQNPMGPRGWRETGLLSYPLLNSSLKYLDNVVFVPR